MKQDKTKELDIILDRAEEFHGHLGPFLVLGVRMGIIGVRKLGAKGDIEELRVTAMVKDSTPFSCVIDGIQVATKCTIGNRKLRLKKSSRISTKFKLQKGVQVTVAVNPSAFDRLKNKLLSENLPTEEVRNMAKIVASLPEEELFIIRRK